MSKRPNKIFRGAKPFLWLSLTGMLSVGAVAASPPDVPPSHWAAKSVKSLTAKKILGALPDGKFHGDKPVTRYELAVALDRFIQYIEAGRKPLHPMAVKSSLVVPSSASPTVKAALIHLTSAGFVPSSSPILHGTGSEPVTAQQLADTLAQVTIRLSDRSLPPTKN